MYEGEPPNFGMDSHEITCHVSCLFPLPLLSGISLSPVPFITCCLLLDDVVDLSSFTHCCFACDTDAVVDQVADDLNRLVDVLNKATLALQLRVLRQRQGEQEQQLQQQLLQTREEVDDEL